MNPRTPAVALGAAVTTFLAVAVLVIEALDFEFSALIGLPVGLLVGVVVFAAILVAHDGLGDPLRWTLAGLAGFGYGIFAVLGASYVNLVELGLTPTVGVALAVGVVAALGAALFDRREATDRRGGGGGSPEHGDPTE